MPIISTLPFNIQNGTLEDATQVMANFNQIVSQVNTNLAATGGAGSIGALASANNPAVTVQGQLNNIGSSTGATYIGYTPAAVGLMIGATIQAALDNFNAVAPPTPWSGFAERTINGDMRIDQRHEGAAQTITAAAATAYTVDRFYAYCTGANVTGQQVAGTAPDQFYYQFTGAASVTAIGFGQRYESFNVYDLAGSTATFSAVLANSLLTSVTWTAYYPTSTDTWPTNNTGRTQIATGTFTVNSTPTKYSAQITLPTSAQAGLEIELTVGAQVSGTWKIGRFSLLAGSNPQNYERRPLPTELAMCQRYYEKSFPFGVAPAQNAGSSPYSFSQNIAAGSPHRGQEACFRVSKRISGGTAVTYNPAAANSSARNLQRSADAAVSNTSATTNGFSFTISAATGSVAGDQNQLHWSVDAEL